MTYFTKGMLYICIFVASFPQIIPNPFNLSSRQLTLSHPFRQLARWVSFPHLVGYTYICSVGGLNNNFGTSMGPWGNCHAKGWTWRLERSWITWSLRPETLSLRWKTCLWGKIWWWFRILLQDGGVGPRACCVFLVVFSFGLAVMVSFVCKVLGFGSKRLNLEG